MYIYIHILYIYIYTWTYQWHRQPRSTCPQCILCMFAQMPRNGLHCICTPVVYVNEQILMSVYSYINAYIATQVDIYLLGSIYTCIHAYIHAQWAWRKWKRNDSHMCVCVCVGGVITAEESEAAGEVESDVQGLH